MASIFIIKSIFQHLFQVDYNDPVAFMHHLSSAFHVRNVIGKANAGGEGDRIAEDAESSEGQKQVWDLNSLIYTPY